MVFFSLFRSALVRADKYYNSVFITEKKKQGRKYSYIFQYLLKMLIKYLSLSANTELKNSHPVSVHSAQKSSLKSLCP